MAADKEGFLICVNLRNLRTINFTKESFCHQLRVNSLFRAPLGFDLPLDNRRRPGQTAAENR